MRWCAYVCVCVCMEKYEGPRSYARVCIAEEDTNVVTDLIKQLGKNRGVKSIVENRNMTFSSSHLEGIEVDILWCYFCIGPGPGPGSRGKRFLGPLSPPVHLSGGRGTQIGPSGGHLWVWDPSLKVDRP